MRGFNTLHFETSLEGGIPGGGLTPDGLDAEPVAPAESEQDSWEGITEEQFIEMQNMLLHQQQQLQQLDPVREYMQGAPGPEQSQAPQLPTDPYDPGYQQQMLEYLDYRDQQRLAPFQEIVETQNRQQMTESAMDMIHDVIQTKGELIEPQYGEGQEGPKTADVIYRFALSYAQEMVRQYGDQGTRADEMAIDRAYEDAKMLFGAVNAANDTITQNRLSTLSNAPREPGNSGVAAQQVVSTQPGGWDAFKARNGLS